MTNKQLTLDEMIEQLDAMRAEAGPMLEAIKTAENAIRAHCLVTGEKHERIQFRAGYKALRWNSKALHGYAAAYPEIMQFATEYERGPSVAIKGGDA